MAGVKGRSGGPRANSGGARPGAGRKPTKPRKTRSKSYQTDDPDEFLRAVMRDPQADFKDRMAAALALKKSGSGSGPGLLPIGKREGQQRQAERVARGGLEPLAPPTRARALLRAVK